ncbi:MAG: hypothetical protein WAV95_14965 [Azonexus sp.]
MLAKPPILSSCIITGMGGLPLSNRFEIIFLWGQFFIGWLIVELLTLKELFNQFLIGFFLL